MSTHLAVQLRRWRHDLHRIPETGLAEHRTGDYLAAALKEMGLDVTPGGPDSDAIMYSTVLSAHGKTYCFYNGNGFGATGICLAELTE